MFVFICISPFPGKILQPPSRVLGVFVDLRHDDITPAVANCLETLPCWKTVVIDETGENSDFMIGKHCQEILSRQQNLSVSPQEPKFKLFPRKLSPGQSKLLIKWPASSLSVVTCKDKELHLLIVKNQ